MGYSSISLWTVKDWTPAMEDTARSKFVPMIMAVGADRVRMVRTGDLSFAVITDYADEAKAMAAQEKIAQIRSQASGDLDMTLASASSGAVFAQG